MTAHASRAEGADAAPGRPTQPKAGREGGPQPEAGTPAATSAEGASRAGGAGEPTRPLPGRPTQPKAGAPAYTGAEGARSHHDPAPAGASRAEGAEARGGSAERARANGHRPRTDHPTTPAGGHRPEAGTPAVTGATAHSAAAAGDRLGPPSAPAGASRASTANSDRPDAAQATAADRPTAPNAPRPEADGPASADKPTTAEPADAAVPKGSPAPLASRASGQAERARANGHRPDAAQAGAADRPTAPTDPRPEADGPNGAAEPAAAEDLRPHHDPAPAGASRAGGAAEPLAAAEPAPASPRPEAGGTAGWLGGGLVVALVVVALASAAIGAYDIPLGDLLSSVRHRLHLGGQPLDRIGESVLWDVRLPRVVLAMLVGASLGCAGALMQGVFGNPLAEPGVIGVSTGAAVGAVAAIAFGVEVLGNWTVTVFAFVTGLFTVLLVYALSRSGGRSEVVTLILTGIAVNAFAMSLVGLFIFFADNAQISQITFWQLGSLAQSTWPKVLAVLPCAALGLLAAPVYARRLDLLALGERPARHLGVDVERLRISLILVVALLTAAAVAVAGVISFVGLVVPHLLRMVAGPGHRFLVPASAVGGALVLLSADLVARTVAEPAELPLGVITGLIGSPFFFWLLRRTRSRQGGWA
ncbi:hypothetical protein GCM10022245_67460 [Streptomyces mayteni]